MYMNRVVDFLKFKDKNILKRFNKDEITIYTKETDEDAFTRMQFEFLNKNKYKNDIREVDNTHRIMVFRSIFKRGKQHYYDCGIFYKRGVKENEIISFLHDTKFI